MPKCLYYYWNKTCSRSQLFLIDCFMPLSLDQQRTSRHRSYSYIVQKAINRTSSSWASRSRASRRCFTCKKHLDKTHAASTHPSSSKKDDVLADSINPYPLDLCHSSIKPVRFTKRNKRVNSSRDNEVESPSAHSLSLLHTHTELSLFQ